MASSADPWITGRDRPAMATSGRCHGSLNTITDSERRAIRPIGATAYEVAARTGVLLATLLGRPGVHIFQGVRPAPADGAQRIPHAISAGRQLIFVESVAWPPGRYTADAGGRIHCDGTYIGQSTLPLVNVVRQWRQMLPRGHLVSALVVVHPTAEGELVLPAAIARDLAWTSAADAVRDIGARLPRGRQAASTRAVAALVAAIAGDEAAIAGAERPAARSAAERRQAQERT